MSMPTDLRYTPEHEWLRIRGATAVVGVTAYATDALGEVVYVDLPVPGTALTKGSPCGEVESTKSVSDIYAPADGEILEVNQSAVEDPSLLNTDPYGEGWLFKMSVTEVPELLDALAYQAHLGRGA